MSVRTKIEQLCARMHDAPQYPTQGAVLFVDLERRETRSKYLPAEIMRTFLGGRGANMVAALQPARRGRTRSIPKFR
jgi:aldehyde:ferredoxin oxidoreductase